MNDNQDSPQEPVVQETVEAEETYYGVPTPQDNSGPASEMLNLESVINMTLSKIDRLSQELRKQNEMVESVLMGDPTYRQHVEQAKEALKIKNTTKSEIMKRPDVRPIAEKVKELRAEIKDAKESLSSYLPEYHKVSGQTTIEGEDGQVRQILYIAKLVKAHPKK